MRAIVTGQVGMDKKPYLEAVRDPLPLYASIAHPGWLLRDANYVLASNVRCKR